MALPAAYVVGDGENGPAVSEYQHRDDSIYNQLQICEQFILFLQHLFRAYPKKWMALDVISAQAK